MPKISRINLRQLFSKGAKPAQEAFYNWLDSFWHKDDLIEVEAVKGLKQSLDQKLDIGAQDTILNEFNSFKKEVTETVKTGYLAYLKKADTKPVDGWKVGLYKLIEMGQYNNLTPAKDKDGNATTIVFVDGKINEVYWNGSFWSKNEISIPATALAESYNKDNDEDALSAKVIDIHMFGGYINAVESEVTMLPLWNHNLLAGEAAYGVKFIPEHPLFAEDQAIPEIKINGFGNIDIYTCDAKYQDLKKVRSLNLTIDGDNTFSGLNLELPANRRLGISLVNGTFRFSNNTTGATKTWGSNTTKIENITLALKFKRIPKTSPFIEGVVPNLIENEVANQINNLELTQSNLNKVLFSDDFSTQKNSWIATDWNFDADNKRWTSTTTGRDKRLFLNRIYNLNKRKATFRIIPSADSDFRIELRNGLTGVVDGESMFSINFAEQKIKIFNVLLAGFPNANVESYGVSETSVLKEVPLNIPFVAGREYIVELRYEETLHTLIVIDTISGSKTTLTQDGWIGGRQQQSYSFYVFTGGVVSIKDFKVFALENFFDVVFVGDSITEGVMVQDKSKRWWKQMEPFIDGKIAVCARGGQTVQDIIDKFPYELAILKPKYAVFLIGINDGFNSTVARYSQIKSLCEANGISPRFCYLNATNGKPHIGINQNIITAVGLKNMGFHFELATSINNDGINYNPALYYDGAHPKETGTAEMMKRVFIDIPEILK